MRILITGGAGFLGSHLSDLLLSEGHHIICLDNFYTGRRENIAHLSDHERFTFVEHDVCEPYHFEVDQIYNLASPASPPHYQKDPVFTTETNYKGTLHALQLARKTGARIFQASTSEVYGDPEVHPQSEDYRGAVNPIGIRACYDEGKRVAETLCFDFLRTYNTDIRVVRIFNTYGPRMNPEDGRVVSNFIVQALRGENITIYGDGSQTRSFCYVDDLIDGFVRLMKDESPHGPVNIGNPGEFTILQLANEVLAQIKSDSQLVYQDLPSDDPLQRQPVIAIAQEKLDWSPKIPLAEGLSKTIAHFQSELSL